MMGHLKAGHMSELLLRDEEESVKVLGKSEEEHVVTHKDHLVAMGVWIWAPVHICANCNEKI